MMEVNMLKQEANDWKLCALDHWVASPKEFLLERKEAFRKVMCINASLHAIVTCRDHETQPMS